VRALDGDGVQVRVGERLENLRYLGVRTPVICHPITGPEAYRHQAAAANAELVEGREVTVVPAAEARDAAGRLLATVLLEGRSVGAELVRRGFAEVVTTPPHRRERRELLGVQAAAQAARAGLWADPAARRYYCPRRTGVLASPRTMSFFHVDDDKAYFEERLEVFESPEAAIEAGYTPSFDFKVHEERDWRARVRAVAETVTLPASAVVVAPPPPPPATGHIWRGGTVIPVHR
jgi:endonuclease YncB( thermonuclease family)